MNKRLECIKLLGSKCVKCGSIEHLEFDHIDPEQRNFRIGSAIQSWSKLLEELKLCQLLCHDCHVIKTKTERKPIVIKHGTTGAYTNHKCRCADCTAVWARYNYNRSLHWNGIKYMKTV